MMTDKARLSGGLFLLPPFSSFLELFTNLAYNQATQSETPSIAKQASHATYTRFFVTVPIIANVLQSRSKAQVSSTKRNRKKEHPL